MPPRGRRDPPALLVFIRGRWQSVPPGSGYAVVRRGRLEVLRSATVSGALRRLQMGLPSKARFGPRLSFKKIPPSYRENSDNEVTLIEPKQINQQNEDVRPSKRTRDSTSSEEPVQRVTTVATVHAVKQRKTSKNHQLHIMQLSCESKSSEESGIDLKKQTSKEILMKSPKKLSRTDLINQKSTEIMISPRNLPDSPKRSLSLRRKPVEQTNSSKQSSPILKSKDLSEKQISRYLQPRSEKHDKSPKKGETVISDSDFESDQSEILKSKTKQIQSPKKIKGISNSEFGTKNEKSPSNNQNKSHKIGPKRQKLDQDTSESESPQKAEKIFLRPNATYQTQPQKLGTRTELDIDEPDIEILRIFMQNHYSDKVLLKFDSDDDFKRMIFFRINPLVNIYRCPIIDRMLRRSQESQITLTDFASNLGLQSVTQAKEKRTTKERDSETSNAKANNKHVESAKERATRPNHNTVESESEESNSKQNINKPEKAKKLAKPENRITVESNSDASNAKANIKKAVNAKERTTRANHNTVESESEESKAKENNNKAVIAKERRTRANDNTVESDSEESNDKENNRKAGIEKERTKRANHNTVESDSEVSNTKENNKKDSNTKKQTKREVRNKDDTDSEASNTLKHNKKDINAKKQTKREQRNLGESDSEESNVKRVNRKEIDNTVDTVELSSDSEKGEAVKAINKTAKPKPVISSKRRRPNLGYSSLEDQAIVAWVSTGSRASRVNGNLLWRQLQDQYTQISGCRRTWHSLRNRYLRYILPRLGDLALPLSQQTRLRAAAATGEIKTHRVRSPRRNSIFKLPTRGAASRRPAATNDDTETETKELPSKSSPSYSSLTRQFAHRHNLNRPSSELSDNSQRSNKLKVADKKEPQAKGNSPKKPYTEINSPRKQINGKATGNEHSDSDKRSESPSIDTDSSDSSSESDDESTKINEPRRTRRSVNDANKVMSRSDTRVTNESNRRLTRQSNILDESNVSISRKSRDENNKHKSAREKTNKSPSRKVNRHKSPNEQTSRDSSESMSQSRRKSPENNRRRSRRQTRNRNESDDASKRGKSPNKSISRSPTRKLNSNKSSSIQSSKGSNMSMRQVRRKSKSPIKRKNTRNDSSSEESDSSSGSVSQPRRKSNRIKSPKDQSNRRKPNRLISPMKQNGRLSSDSPKRKSNRLTPNESSNKRRHSSESKRKSKLAKRDSLDEIVISDSSESFQTKKSKKDLIKKVDPTKKKVEKKKLRRLFNPKAML